MSEFVNDVDASNTVDGKPVIYWVNEQDKTVPSDAGYVVLIGCTNITVQGLVLTNNSQGVLLVATDNSLIASNYIGNNFYGIAFQGSYGHCYNNVISNNNITENANDGIYSWGAYNTNVTGNSITNNQGDDIHFYESPNAYIVGNYITGNIDINDSANSTVEQNDAELAEDEIPDALPELPSWIILPLLLTATLAIMVCKRKLTKNR
jgi:parallel beta-helix repeat protein